MCYYLDVIYIPVYSLYKYQPIELFFYHINFQQQSPLDATRYASDDRDFLVTYIPPVSHKRHTYPPMVRR